MLRKYPILNRVKRSFDVIQRFAGPCKFDDVFRSAGKSKRLTQREVDFRRGTPRAISPKALGKLRRNVTGSKKIKKA